MRFSWQDYMNPRIMGIMLLGFSSGLPLALTSGTLQVWFTSAGLGIVTIGALSLVGQPYIYKFLWAPFFDRFTPIKRLGRRRSWVVILQASIVVLLVVMSLCNPAHHAYIIAFIALCVATCSASQDIGIDAYRTDIATVQERGLAASVFILFYRFAMVISGAVAVVMAVSIGWRLTYLVMAALMMICLIVTLFVPEPHVNNQPKSLSKAVIEPWKEFLSRHHSVFLIVVFIILYKLCDAFALSLNAVFLMRGIGFSQLVVGSMGKTLGLFGSLVGTLVAGVLMVRIRLFTALWVFGLLQALSNIGYWLLALLGKKLFIMSLVVFVEYFCGALSSVAFVAYLMSLCHSNYTATQYALLSALAAVGRVYVGPVAAVMVEHMGWVWFYASTVMIGMLPLMLLWLATLPGIAQRWHLPIPV